MQPFEPVFREIVWKAPSRNASPSRRISERSPDSPSRKSSSLGLPLPLQFDLVVVKAQYVDYVQARQAFIYVVGKPC